MVTGLKLVKRKKQMKSFASTHSCTQNKAHVREHSPITDLQAYETRQRKFKRQKLLKNLAETSVFFTASAVIFSLLFWGV